MVALTPIVKDRKIQNRPLTMSFFDALRKIQTGKTVARISWGNRDYCLMKDGWLSIFTERDGKFHTWSVNDGDMDSDDWTIISEVN